MVPRQHSLLAEGTDAGLLGGSTVAVWFLIRDLLRGHPLATPSVLGQVLVFGEKSPVLQPLDFAAIILYTGAHFIVFVLFGLVAAWLVRLSAREPVFLFALLVLFVTFEVAFYVLINAVSSEVGDMFPLWSVGCANLFAAAVMAYYFWRKYPEIKQALAEEPLGA
jgi:glycopeptide antibiotics resistance protein